MNSYQSRSSDDLRTGSDKTITTINIQDYWTYLGNTYNYFASSVDLILGLQAILINMLIILFYLNKLSRVVPLMYVAIASVDFITGIGAMLSGTVFALIETGNYKYGLYLTYGIYFITLVTFKVSAFLNCTIAVIRTINIILPFYEVKMTCVTIAVMVYSATCFSFAAYIFKQSIQKLHHTMLVTYLYKPEGSIAFKPDKSEDYSTNQWIVVMITIASTAVPAVIVFICMVIQIESLKPWKRSGRNDTIRSYSGTIGRSANTSTIGRNSATHAKLTVTIIMLSVLFTICNLSHMIAPITVLRTDLSQLTEEQYTQHYRVSYAMGSIALYINAAWSPVILVIRGEALIRFLRTKLTFSPSASSSKTKKMGILTPASPSPSARPRKVAAKQQNEADQFGCQSSQPTATHRDTTMSCI